MAYVSANMNLMVPQMGNAPAIWLYFGTDIHTTVAGADFITDGVTKGMKVDDVVFVIKTSATKGVTIHTVLAGTSPAVTLNAAILA